MSDDMTDPPINQSTKYEKSFPYSMYERATVAKLKDLTQRLNTLGYQIIPLLPELDPSMKARITGLLERHVHPEDMKLTDRDFVQAVFMRWARDAGAHLGDPNE